MIRAHVGLLFHEAIPVGPSFDLRDYLNRQRISRLTVISHPLLENREAVANRSYRLVYHNGKLVRRMVFPIRLPSYLSYLKDILLSVVWVSASVRFDALVCYDPLNTLAGLICRKFGRTHRVVYVTIDLFSRRFANEFLNRLYHALDRYCVSRADETWNLSPVMASVRAKQYGMTGTTFSRQITVPIAVDTSRFKPLPLSAIRTRNIVFVGYLIPLLGVDLLIRAIRRARRTLPDLTADILGGGPELDRLRSQVRSFDLDGSVAFHGWVKDRASVHRLLATSAVGLAPFNTTLGGDEIENADPAKIKEYMLAGLPVITTKSVYYWRDIVREDAGLVIPYSEGQLAYAIVTLLSDRTLLSRYRKNASRFVGRFGFSEVFGPNIQRILSGTA